MSPDNPAVIHNDAVATENFRIDRPSTGNRFKVGPSAGVSFVNSFLSVIDTRVTEETYQRGELSFLNDPDETDGGHWCFLPSYPKDKMENLGPHEWDQADLLELTELMRQLQPESQLGLNRDHIR